MLADPGRAEIIGTDGPVVVTRGFIGEWRIAGTVIAADVVGAFIAVVIAWPSGNRHVSALPFQTDIVRAGILVIIARTGVWIGIMGALESLADICGTFVSIVRTRAGNA